MAAQLVDSLAADFDSAAFTDDYQDQLRTLVEAKLKEGDSLDTEATFGVEDDPGERAEVVDLMEALKRSIDNNKAGEKAAPRKTAARRSRTKKAAS